MGTKGTLLWSALVTLASLASAGPRGTVPRSAADRYPAHAEKDGMSVGAVLLASDQVRKAFAADVNRCCVVVEVAFYPPKDKPQPISLSDFSLRVVGSETAVKADSAGVAAASIQKSAEEQRDVSVTQSVGIGYESGTYVDPVTGARTTVHGVKRETGGEVAAGNGAHPGSSDSDRDAMEAELAKKGLPEGAASTPVAGYLYFPLTKKKDASLQLECILNGDKTVLTLH